MCTKDFKALINEIPNGSKQGVAEILTNLESYLSPLLSVESRTNAAEWTSYDVSKDTSNAYEYENALKARSLLHAIKELNENGFAIDETILMELEKTFNDIYE